MQKKILAVLLILSMLLTFAACGGSAGNGGANNGGGTDANQVDTDNKTETPKSSRDKTWELTNTFASCTLEYDSKYCLDYKYIDESEKNSVYIFADGGQAIVTLMRNTSEEGYVDFFKKEKNAGNGSHYYVKDLVVEAAESCEVNGYKYTLYSFSYKDVYPSQNKEFDENGMFGYVQVGEDVSLLIEECSFSDFAGFVESALYIKDATIN